MLSTSCPAFSRIVIDKGIHRLRRPHNSPHLVWNRRLFPSCREPKLSPFTKSSFHCVTTRVSTNNDDIEPNRQSNFLRFLSHKQLVPSSLSTSASVTTRSKFMARRMSSSSSSRDDSGKKKLNQKQKQKRAPTQEESNNTLAENNVESAIEQETRDWVTRVVVGLNLCPFAAKPVLSDHQLYVSVVRGCQTDDILRSVLVQALVLTGPDALPGTALVVCPDLYPHDFQRYLTVLSMIVDGLLVDHDLEGQVQVVPFHPKFVFAASTDEDEEPDDDDDDDDDDGYSDNASEVDNGYSADSNDEVSVDDDNLEYWTNRSPYPMFHILKEEDVSRAVQIMKGDTDRVWQRNVFLLQRLQELCTAEYNSRTTLKGSTTSQSATISSEPISKQTLLEAYLSTGVDDEDQSIKAMVQQALQETAMEFPVLKNPIAATKKGSIPDGDGPKEGGKGSLD